MFSTDQVCALTDVTYRKMDYWTRAGLVVPTVEAHGSGTQRRYDIDELYVVCVIAELMNLGSGTAAAGRAAEWLRMSGARVTGRIFVDSEGFIVDGDRARSCYMVDLTAIREQLDARAAETFDSV